MDRKTRNDAGGSTVEHALLLVVVAAMSLVMAALAQSFVTGLIPSSLP
jgi:Flp pilus assembly pilin Flp